MPHTSTSTRVAHIVSANRYVLQLARYNASGSLSLSLCLPSIVSKISYYIWEYILIWLAIISADLCSGSHSIPQKGSQLTISSALSSPHDAIAIANVSRACTNMHSIFWIKYWEIFTAQWHELQIPFLLPKYSTVWHLCLKSSNSKQNRSIYCDYGRGIQNLTYAWAVYTTQQYLCQNL